MLWRTYNQPPFHWHRWFAWYPVRVSGYYYGEKQFAWLEPVERIVDIDHRVGCWKYRLPGSS